MISIIIPTLNAAPELKQTILAVKDSKLVNEIFVVDGGSTDGTQKLARSLDVNLISSHPGRGEQLLTGAAAATSKWLLFLHGDTVLSSNWDEIVSQFIKTDDSESLAGYFKFKLNDEGSWAKWLEKFVAWRSNIFGLPYGDQGLLVSSRLYTSLRGFRQIPLMEDVDLIRQIGRKNLIALNARASTSAARYTKRGYPIRMIRNGFCLMFYFLGISPKLIAKVYS